MMLAGPLIRCTNGSGEPDNTAGHHSSQNSKKAGKSSKVNNPSSFIIKINSWRFLVYAITSIVGMKYLSKVRIDEQQHSTLLVP